MHRRISALALPGLLALMLASCHHNRVQNPIANVNSQQPDKVLFDRAMNAMKHAKYDVARMSLQTLINTYPDSEYIARAKLAVGDSWYAEGGTAGLAQAEIEYKDFITFFPNLPEAAEAQLKIADIHYRGMEKPDRDFTHAKHAEEEYRQLVLQFPDSKLLPQAKQRLREVQEVLAEREFRIGRFYFLRQSWPAAIARLKSVTDSYPLYSRADDSLFMLGNAYEHQIENVRRSKMTETQKSALIKQLNDQAAVAYDRIITRYPVGGRAGDAKGRLLVMHRSVPTPTPQAIAQNKAEEASRSETGFFGGMWGNFRRSPDVARATKVGEPTLEEEKTTSAKDVVQSEVKALSAPAESNKVGIEAVGEKSAAQPAAKQPSAPAASTAGSPQTGAQSSRSATPSAPAPASSNDNSIPELKIPSDNSNPNSTDSSSSQPAGPAPEASAAPSTSSATEGSSAPAAATTAPAAPAADASSSAASSDNGNSANSTNGSSTQGDSSSKSKKKKGLRKLVPF